MENQVQQEAKNTPEQNKALLEETTIFRVDPPSGQQGLRINTSTKFVPVNRSDSLRAATENIRRLKKQKDSIRKIYE